MNSKNHIWQFSRVGGVNRVNLESGADLVNLSKLDQKLWAALSCPVQGLEIDHKTLEIIDSDNDGKIRVPEILNAVKWIIELINNPDDLLQRREAMPLSAINSSTPLGKTLLSSAKQIVANLGKTDTTFLTIEETSDTTAIFANTAFNGDGIITEDSSSDLEIKKWIQIIIEKVASAPDRGGKQGISQEHLNSFVEYCEQYAQWNQKLEDNKALIHPYNENTEEAYQLFIELKSKIDDYFLRCKLALFDPESAQTLNALTTRIELITNENLSESYAQIEGFPISKIEADQKLSFKKTINPTWEESLLKFRAIIFASEKSLPDALTEHEWNLIVEKFTHYSSWKAEKLGEIVESLGLDEIKAFLASSYKEQMIVLIEKDKELEEEANNIILVDKLVRYYCHIYTLLNNFVTFSDFYSLKIKGIFQAGVLYYDQRSCDLCIKVTDMAKHNLMASTSGICLVYFNCVSISKNEQMTIVAAFTDGDIDDLAVGRNAIFYDNDGLDWDATVIKIIENSISIRQAFWTPYRKVSKLVGRQIEKITSSQDDKVHASASASVTNVGSKTDATLHHAINSPEAAVQPQTQQPAPFDIAKFAGIFAAIGLAFGAIGSALASIIGGFLALTYWKIPLALMGIVLAISGPSMILAWLKLRKRNLAPVLDANGWAINAKATINIPFGATLTHLVKLPLHSKLNLKDPFREKQNPLIPIGFAIALLVILVGLWFLGFFEYIGLI